MGKLLKKNLLLNKKNIVLGILVSIIFATIAIDGQNYYTVALLMSPSLLFSFVVGKMCYTEDSISTRQFLLSLPISKRNLVFEKNILSYMCVLIGIFIVNSVSFITDIILNRNLFFDIKIIFIISMFLVIYNTIFIWLNYKYDYSKTQFTSYILLILMFLLFKFKDNILELVQLSDSLLLVLIFIIIIILNYIIIKGLTRSQ